MENLQKIWIDLTQKFDVSPQTSLQIWTAIQTAHQNPKRFYHNLTHIKQLCELIVLYEKKIQNVPILLFTAFFHDFIYLTDNIKPENEKKSAEQARLFLSQMKLKNDFIQTITNYILATQHHLPSQDKDLQYFLDMDLAILGASPNAYAQYAQQIRAEYAHVPLFLYKNGRKKVLQKLLDRPLIFSLLTESLEAQARKNLAWEIATLS